MFESALGIAVVFAFAVVVSAVFVPVTVFVWSFVYRVAIKPGIAKMPVPVQKVLHPLFAMPDMRPKFLKKSRLKRAR